MGLKIQEEKVAPKSSAIRDLSLCQAVDTGDDIVLKIGHKTLLSIWKRDHSNFTIQFSEDYKATRFPRVPAGTEITFVVE